MNPKNIQLLWRIALGVLVGIFFIWVAEQNLSLSGKKTITYQFNGSPHAIIGMWPGQLDIVTEGSSPMVVPLKKTLYFDIKTPVLYKTAYIEIQGTGLGSATLGIRTPPDAWSYRKTPMTSILADTAADVTIDLANASRTNEKYTAALFFDEKSPTPPHLAKMTITLEKDRITLAHIMEKIMAIWKK